MSFFIRKGSKASAFGKDRIKGKGSKKKPNSLTTVDTSRKPRKTRLVGSEDEEILSDSDVEIDLDQRKRKIKDVSSSEEDEETAQEKRLRLAKQYLSQLEDETEADDVTGAISDRLKQDALEQSGKLRKFVASSYQPVNSEDITVLRGHKLSVTCVVITPNDQHIFTGSKDCTIIKWNCATGRKVKVIARAPKTKEKELCAGHSGHVLCLAVSTDNKLLASGDRNKLILLWNPDTCDLLHTFTGHRDVVTGLAFRRGSHQLFSASMDRSVKIWNADEMAYVETLFGHESSITAIDSLTRERAVTSGGSDGSVRIWKVIEESQLVFHGHAGAIDCVSLIDEEHFISGANDNSLALWSVMKKKPITTVSNAHCIDGDKIGAKQNWLTAVSSLTYTDLIASGSKDGQIRLWQCSNDFKKLMPLQSIPMPGFINGLRFSSDGSFLVAAVGQEHSLGRWWSLKQAKNSLCIFHLKKSTP